jgi:PEP-CTERM motif
MQNRIFTLAVMTLLLAGGARPSSLGLYYVLTDSQSAASNNSDIEGDIENVYNSTVGATQSLSNLGFSYTVSGSPNVLGLTSSFDQTSASAGGNSSSSYAAADLAAGIVRADANSPAGNAYSGANAEVYDTLSFNIPGATSSTTTLLTMDFSLDGTFDGNGTVQTKLLFGGSGDAETEWGLNFPPAFTKLNGFVSDSYSLSTSNYTFQGTIAVQGANPTAQIELDLLLSCGAFVSCSEQYQHTGILSLSLPSGVTYTSASGEFLTAPVPEPGTLFLAGLSLAALIATRRMR